MNIDELIVKLIQLKIELGGNTEVLMSFNGCTNSGELLRISEVNITGFFTNPKDPEGEVYDLDSYQPEPGDKIVKMVNLFSNRDKFVDGSGIDFGD